MKDTTEWATIGQIVAPFGIRGEMKVMPLTDIPDRFVSLKKIYLATDHKPHEISSVRPYKSAMFVLKLADINDANFVETLRRCELQIPLSDLSILPPDSYYQHDILGLHVVTLTGQEVGVISDIMVTGGNDVYVLKAEDAKQVLIPAIKDVIKQIDLVRQVMYIDPMPGLLDDVAVVIAQSEEEEEA